MGSKNSFLFSSNINEAIRAILNFFFYKKILHAQKAQNAYKQTKINKGSVFIRLKNIFIIFVYEKIIGTQNAQNAYKLTKIKKAAFLYA